MTSYAYIATINHSDHTSTTGLRTDPREKAENHGPGLEYYHKSASFPRKKKLLLGAEQQYKERVYTKCIQINRSVHDNSSSRARASFKSGLSNPSLNQV